MRTPASFRLFAFTTLFLLHVSNASNKEGYGSGGYPVSSKTASAWILRSKSSEKPVPQVIVYFTGNPGWHKRRWTPSGIENFKLESSDVVLEVSLNPARDSVRVQGLGFRLQQSNVYVVRYVDQGVSKEKVEALGYFELPYGEKPVSIEFLRRYPGIWEKIEPE